MLPETKTFNGRVTSYEWKEKGFPASKKVLIGQIPQSTSSDKTKKKMGGHCPERCCKGSRKVRLKE
jgi:hypothetical protein